MAAGRVNLAQGRAIVASLERLPRTGQFAVSAEQRAAAEAHLVELAAEHDAKALRILGRRVFEVIAPDLAEEFEGRALERGGGRGAAAYDVDDVGGRRRHLPRTLPPPRPARADADQDDPRDLLTRATHPPRRRSGGAQCGIDPDLPTPVRHGIALTQLLESDPGRKTCPGPVAVAPRSWSSMTLDQLMADLDAAGVCTLDTGGRISATEARRLACTRRHHPDGPRRPGPGPRRRPQTPPPHRGDAPRDGRTRRRLHRHRLRSPHQACATPTTTPPGPKAATPTSTTGRLLCPHHHRRIHDPRYQTKHLPDGKVSFHRRE